MQQLYQICTDMYDGNPSTQDTAHIRRSQGNIAVAGNLVLNMKNAEYKQ